MATRADHDGGRRALQVTLGALSGIPLASGLAGVLAGPAPLPGPTSTVTPTLDGEYRFATAFWLATAPLIWSQLPRVEEDSPILPALMGTVFLGGVGRMLAWRASGRPHAVFLPAIALELVGMPAIALWQRRIVRAARDSPAHRN
jgi:hypothetical protein